MKNYVLNKHHAKSIQINYDTPRHDFITIRIAAFVVSLLLVLLIESF